MASDAHSGEKPKATKHRLSTAGRGSEPVDTTASAVVNQRLGSHASDYAANLKGVTRAETSAVNRVGINRAKCLDHCRSGNVAEADHVATFNIDAAFQGKATKAYMPNGSISNQNISPDIVVLSGSTGAKIKEVSAKTVKTVDAAVKGQAGLDKNPQRDYGEMDRLVSKCTGDAVRKEARHRADRELPKIAAGETNRGSTYHKYDQVARKTTEKVTGEGVESTSRTYEESRQIGTKAQDGQVSGADLIGDYGKRSLQGAKQAVARATVIGGTVSIASNTVRAGVRLYRGEADTKTVLVDAAVGTITDTAAAAFKGAASGGATAAARIAAERLIARCGAEHIAARIGQRVLGGSGPAMVAILTCEAAYGTIEVVMGRKTWGDLGKGLTTSAKSTVVSMIGAEIGLLVGGPFGALFGSFALPMAVDFAKKWFQSAEANGEIKTTADLVEAISDAKNIGAALTAMSESQTGLTATRLLQMAGLFVMLGNQGARVFP